MVAAFFAFTVGGLCEVVFAFGTALKIANHKAVAAPTPSMARQAVVRIGRRTPMPTQAGCDKDYRDGGSSPGSATVDGAGEAKNNKCRERESGTCVAADTPCLPAQQRVAQPRQRLDHPSTHLSRVGAIR
jgi:hypothetical protein